MPRELERWAGMIDGLVATSTGCSFLGVGFNSQNPHGTLQLSVAPVLGAFDNLFCNQLAPGTYTVHIHIMLEKYLPT